MLLSRWKCGNDDVDNNLRPADEDAHDMKKMKTRLLKQACNDYDSDNMIMVITISLAIGLAEKGHYIPDMVRGVYRSPTLRNYINIVVVKLIIFESISQTPFKISSNPASTLKAFCRWQSEINDFTPYSEKHHDTAILITREDFCRAPGKCESLGLAEIGTICDKIRSCSIIEDNGISAAFTIAHELGHVFNLPHDDDKKCYETLQDNQKNTFHVMAASLNFHTSPWDWSNCSARFMTDFLESGQAWCLHDGMRVKKYSDIIDAYSDPGTKYSLKKQCRLSFGQGYTVCSFVREALCRRLWCSNPMENGCQTKHMPWADGTPCARGKICVRGSCEHIPNLPVKAINGGWGPWKPYGPCSRTCGGGVKMKYRECNNPVPQNEGHYCLGIRVKYRSCNIKNCEVGSEDFRDVQCNSDKMRRKIQGFSDNTAWKAKIVTGSIKNACKLYCTPVNGSSYFLFAKRVLDGTKCGPYTDDICVNGQCFAVGCDNRLGSSMKRDRCGVCGGDNFTCRTVTGSYNNAKFGYNLIATIPSGATEIDIRQYGTNRSYIDDENYLAMANANDDYILNGGYAVRTEPYEVKVKGALLEYTGTARMVERINTTMMIAESLRIYVLTVGRLKPPNVTYSYMVSVTKNFKWMNLGWGDCSATCNGMRRSKIQCVREDDNLIVSKKQCRSQIKPGRLTERCNTNCQLSWQTVRAEECPVRCGWGVRRQLVHCMKKTGWDQAEIVSDQDCQYVYGAKPSQYVRCQGLCLPVSWSYSNWSACSVTCGDGVQERQAVCVDESGKQLEDKECDPEKREISKTCSPVPCPQWSTGNWLECSVTCGEGTKRRKVWCTQEGKQVDEALCKTEKPLAIKECHLKTCPEWYSGGWGPCSVTCGNGMSMRAVKCRMAETFQEDSICDEAQRPVDKRACFMGLCPTIATTTTEIITKPTPPQAYWRYGSWTECSATCGSGMKNRFVTCIDYHGNRVQEIFCSHLSRPPKEESCMLKPCGDWRLGQWGDCTVTCGEGLQVRYVVCTFGQQRQDDSFCDVEKKPDTEIRCNRGTCLTPEEDYSIAEILTNRVTGTSHWRVGSWSTCSSTCGTGWERRRVVCYDERGSSNKCDMKLKPDHFRSCNNGPCPSWTSDDWSDCSATKCNTFGVQTRRLTCSMPTGKTLAFSKCDARKKPLERQMCQASCSNAAQPLSPPQKSPRSEWKTGKWSSVRNHLNQQTSNNNEKSQYHHPSYDRSKHYNFLLSLQPVSFINPETSGFSPSASTPSQPLRYRLQNRHRHSTPFFGVNSYNHKFNSRLNRGHQEYILESNTFHTKPSSRDREHSRTHKKQSLSDITNYDSDFNNQNSINNMDHRKTIRSWKNRHRQKLRQNEHNSKIYRSLWPRSSRSSSFSKNRLRQRPNDYKRHPAIHTLGQRTYENAFQNQQREIWSRPWSVNGQRLTTSLNDLNGRQSEEYEQNKWIQISNIARQIQLNSSRSRRLQQTDSTVTPKRNTGNFYSNKQGVSHIWHDPDLQDHQNLLRNGRQSLLKHSRTYPTQENQAHTARRRRAPTYRKYQMNPSKPYTFSQDSLSKLHTFREDMRFGSRVKANTVQEEITTQRTITHNSRQVTDNIWRQIKNNQRHSFAQDSRHQNKMFKHSQRRPQRTNIDQSSPRFQHPYTQQTQHTQDDIRPISEGFSSERSGSYSVPIDNAMERKNCALCVPIDAMSKARLNHVQKRRLMHLEVVKKRRQRRRRGTD
ncbi:A disintegrin and metalloproteinase with thrombospondin motifs 9 [Plakobranchus ocellatus]|uniref:A disintegrin and metalloproteinase with thrombospondin motifs 9 n=1 Tax=Plakobranchus ocellatus TaxID=259542 RepID=A0AAV3YN00_9GAST|nr:A disintegrin and metalloproteinase with thrombospondin motifs 9 [Plakobranchus ocellatus]